jgi:hypothetical protein
MPSASERYGGERESRHLDQLPETVADDPETESAWNNDRSVGKMR